MLNASKGRNISQNTMEKLLFFVYFCTFLVTGIQNCEVALSPSGQVMEGEPLSLTCVAIPNVNQIKWIINGFTIIVDRTQCERKCNFDIPRVDCDHSFKITEMVVTISYFNIMSVPLSLNGTAVSCATDSVSCNSSSQNFTFIVKTKVKETTINPTSTMAIQTSKFLYQGTTSDQNKTSTNSSLKPHIKMSNDSWMSMYDIGSTALNIKDTTFPENLKRSSAEHINDFENDSTASPEVTINLKTLTSSSNDSTDIFTSTHKNAPQNNNEKGTAVSSNNKELSTAHRNAYLKTKSNRLTASTVNALHTSDKTVALQTLEPLTFVHEIISTDNPETFTDIKGSSETTFQGTTKEHENSTLTSTLKVLSMSPNITKPNDVITRKNFWKTEDRKAFIDSTTIFQDVSTNFRNNMSASKDVTEHTLYEYINSTMYTKTRESINSHYIASKLTKSPAIDVVDTETTNSVLTYSSSVDAVDTEATNSVLTDSSAVDEVDTKTTNLVLTDTSAVDGVDTKTTNLVLTDSSSVDGVDTETTKSFSSLFTTSKITESSAIYTATTNSFSPYFTTSKITDHPGANENETTQPISSYFTALNITDSPAVDEIDTGTEQSIILNSTTSEITDVSDVNGVDTEIPQVMNSYFTTPKSIDAFTVAEVETETFNSFSQYFTTSKIRDSSSVDGVDTETTRSNSSYITRPKLTDPPTVDGVDTETTNSFRSYIITSKVSDSSSVGGVDTQTTQLTNSKVTDSLTFKTSYHVTNTDRSNRKSALDDSDISTAIYNTITNNGITAPLENSTYQNVEDDENDEKKTTASFVRKVSKTYSSKTFSDSNSLELKTPSVFDIHTTKEHENASTTSSTTLLRRTKQFFATGVYQKYHASKITSLPSTISAEQVTCKRNVDNRGTVWNVTLSGNIVTFPCTNINAGLSGDIVRQCTVNGAWVIPKYDCVRKDITNLTRLLDANPPDAVIDHVLDTLSTLTTPGKNGDNLYSGEIDSITNMLENIANIPNLNVTDNQAKTFMMTASNIIDFSTSDSWKAIDQNTPEKMEPSGVSKLLDVVGTYVDVFASSLPETEDKKTVSVSNILLQVQRVNHSSSIEFPDSDYEQKRKSALTLSPDALKGSTIFSAVLYGNLLGIMPIEASFNRKAVLQSSVLTAKLNNWKMNKDFKIKIAFEHAKVKDSRVVCSFRNEKSVMWGRKGCFMTSQNTTTTICECNHLTNFAILMSPWIKENVKTIALDYLSIIGCSVSSLCLVLTMITHLIFWRNIKSERVKILMNLCAALVISYIIFLVGVDRTEDKDGCAAVAALLHYIYLVVFFFMLAEGIEIFFALVYVFSMKTKTKWIIPAAWLIPAVIVGISLAATRIRGYGDKTKCWLSSEKGQIWAFVGPAFIIILINCVILVLSLRAIFSVQMVRNKRKTEKAVTGIRSLCVLLPLVGCTWIIGIFYVDKSMDWIQYLFAVCNGLQGLVIFIFHCAMNKQIMKAIMNVVNRNRKEKKCLSLPTSTSTSSLQPRMHIKRKSKTNLLPLSELFLRSSGTVTDSEVSQNGICNTELKNEILEDRHFKSSNYQDTVSFNEYNVFTHL